MNNIRGGFIKVIYCFIISKEFSSTRIILDICANKKKKKALAEEKRDMIRGILI